MQSEDPDDDLQIIESARGGDADAFRSLVGRYHARLHAWAMALTGDADDADDVEQTALVRIHRGLPGYQGTARFTTWLYPIVRSAAADLHRSRRRRSGILERISASEAAADAGAIDAESLDRRRLTELVLRFFEELPARQREIFNLIDLQGYTAGEVAKMVGVEAVTVRTHLLRARRTLRGRVLEHHPELVEGL
jgi:RNA polymerase sigma factor (sigma-70 family)